MGKVNSRIQYQKKEVQFGENDICHYASCSLQGWREQMEDEILIKCDLQDGNILFGVFDGHGGCQASWFCKRFLSRLLTQNDCYLRGNYEKALIEAFLNLDKAMMSPNGRDLIQQHCQPMYFEVKGNYHRNKFQKLLQYLLNLIKYYVTATYGTTALLVLITKNNIYVANAGDCRAVLNKTNGKLQVLTHDHKPDKEQIRIKSAGYFISDGRINGNLNVSRSLGDFAFKQNQFLKPEDQAVTAQPEITVLERQGISRGDFIILACDGVWECQSNTDLIKSIEKQILCQRYAGTTQLSKVLSSVLQGLVAVDEEAIIGHDNMSAILILFK